MSEVVGWICIRGRGGGCSPITRDDLAVSQQSELPFPDLPGGGHDELPTTVGRQSIVKGRSDGFTQRSLF